ncbi:hypothetical protein Y032_0677g1437 [Ancylostoma ceylanicum]|uniref:Uncharacterized protein n=1 Tax=Ancylostoma ceylanicum TaxID=53326 RepID=A0A016WJC0_9BILA|nr:hypothetical protein Y032_0677g1437 [Ancylostoma ceylanicum]
MVRNGVYMQSRGGGADLCADDRGETAGSLARKENVHSWNGDQQCRKFRASSTLNWSQAPRHLLRLPSTKRLIPPL